MHPGVLLHCQGLQPLCLGGGLERASESVVLAAAPSSPPAGRTHASPTGIRRHHKVLVTIALDGTDSATSSFFKSSTFLTWQTMNRSYILAFAGPSAAPLLPCLTARRPRPWATAR